MAFEFFSEKSGITFSFKQSISIVLSDISENSSSLFITIQSNSKATQKINPPDKVLSLKIAFIKSYFVNC